MHKDSERVDQPENTYRDALNSNLYYSKGAIVNEEGTEIIGTHPIQVIGAIPLLNNQVVSFGWVDDSGAEIPSFNSTQSAIVLTDTKKNSSRILYKDKGLNFQKDYPIKGEFRVDAKNDILIYFTDNYFLEEDTPEGGDLSEYNSPRAFNVTRQLEHLNTSSIGEPYTKLYDDNEDFDVEKLNLFAKVGKHSMVESVNIYEGGVLVSGAYHLALCYSDENFLETDYFVVSNPVYIFQSQEQQYPADIITGCQAGSQTNKAIKFNVRVFKNNNYKFLQPSIIQRVGNAEFAFKLERIELRNNQDNEQIEINFTGNEDSSTTSVEDIMIDNVGYLTAKTLTQLDNRLYLANLRSRKDIGFQRYAHNIKIEAVTNPFDKFDVRVFDIQSLNIGYAIMALPLYNRSASQGAQFGIGQTFIRDFQGSVSGEGEGGFNNEDNVRRNYFEHIQGLLNHGDSGSVIGTGDGDIEAGYNLVNKIAKGYKDYRFSFKNKSFRRNEVYAFYISFVLNDGTETYAYHIPGRHALFKEHPTKPDSFLSENSNIGGTQTSWSNIRETFGFYPSEFGVNDSSSGVYQYVDTSMLNGFVLQPNTGSPGSASDGVLQNHMSFWNNRNERYPLTDDFIGGIVNATGGASINGNDDHRNDFVRHHKMPSNHNDNYSFLDMDEGNNGFSHQSLLTDTLNSTDLLNDNITALVGENGRYKDKKIISRDPIRLLGIKLKNLKIPRHILKKVQGYKIYYAKRKDEDKTVVGQSLAVPSHPRYASVDTQNKLLARLGPFKNAFYLYGGLMQDDSNAMEINSTWKKQSGQQGSGIDSDNGRYIGNPVFTFHDFNMLRKRPTLEGLTHVSCQSAVVFRPFQGGPNLFRKPADFDELTDGTGDSQSGLQGATELTRFRSLGWIHPDLGNTTDFGKSGEIFDITDNFIDLTEDVENPYGYDDGDGPPTGNSKRKRGKARGLDQDNEKLRAQDLMIKHWRTQVNIAAKYIKPGSIFHTEIIKGGDHRYPNNSIFWDAYNVPSTQMLFRLDPKSRIYAQGLVNIEVPESTSFKGATKLFNRGGESSMVFGLDSGLIHLKGWREFDPNYWGNGPAGTNTSSAQPTSWDLVKWGDDPNFLFPDAFYYRGTKLPDHYEEFYGGLDAARKQFRGYRYSLEGNSQYDGYPMAWLVNVESAKTDVYQPFDKQELVWTGYYKAISPKEVELTDGDTEIIGLDTGECTDDYGNNSNYYTGAESANIYGGDTYITKYSFRTTSQSYGHCFFRGATNLGDAGVSDEHEAMHVYSGNKDRFQADLPDFYNAFNASTWGKGAGNMQIWRDWIDNTSDVLTFDEKVNESAALINNVSNWQQGTVDPVSTLFQFMVESDDNIGLRHKNDVDKGISTKYYDADIASTVLFAPPTEDLTKQDNLLYEDHYSALQTIRVTRPYPKRKASDSDITKFNTRVIRSNVAGLSIGDKYRQFLANEFKDLPKNRGDIWNLFTLGGLLYIHTERSLFKTQGKEELNVGGVAAFIGSGNVFATEPVELRDTKVGYGGTTSIYGGVSTPYGRFFISRRDRKIFNMSQGLTEAMNGMESWFRENIPFLIESLGIDVDAVNFGYNPDATTAATPLGFVITYDAKYKRVILTKREPIPTTALIKGMSLNSKSYGYVYIEDNKFYISTFIEHVVEDGDNTFSYFVDEINLGNQTYFKPSGWTLSYYPELQVWGSRHSYLPKLYVSTAETMFSFKDSYMWAHTNLNQPGNFYNTTYPFEVELIDNSDPAIAKSFVSIAYWLDVQKKDIVNTLEFDRRTNPGFTSFYVYNSDQISALSTNLNYLNNVRRVDKFWYINSFRDLSKITEQTSDYINSGLPNVVGGYTNTIEAPISSESMFTEEGVVNAEYIDSTKPWHMQKKFVDHYLGVRLSSDNSSTNLLYLYAAGTKFRKSNR